MSTNNDHMEKDADEVGLQLLYAIGSTINNATCSVKASGNI